MQSCSKPVTTVSAYTEMHARTCVLAACIVAQSTVPKKLCDGQNGQDMAVPKGNVRKALRHIQGVEHTSPGLADWRALQVRPFGEATLTATSTG